MDPKRKILVVDDDRLLLVAMKEVLECGGFSVSVAVDGRQALSQMEGCEPHVVITDIHMPVMDGLELIRWIRREMKSEVPILAVSNSDTHAQRVFLKCAQALGANSILSKPFRGEQLRDSVDALMPA